MKSIIRNIIIAVVVIALGAVGYKLFFAKKQDTSTLQTTSGQATTALPGTSGDAGSVAGAAAAGPVGQDLLPILLNVKSIQLDIGIFSSKAFTILQDFNRPIPPDNDPGRANPFAPLGSDGLPASAQVSTSNPSSITATESTLNGALTASGTNVNRWFEYGLTANLGTATPQKIQTTAGAFAEQITGLKPNTTYYVKAVALVGTITVSGNVVTWKTAQATPTVPAKKSGL